jgi:hypothetical protein
MVLRNARETRSDSALGAAGAHGTARATSPAHFHPSMMQFAQRGAATRTRTTRPAAAHTTTGQAAGSSQEPPGFSFTSIGLKPVPLTSASPSAFSASSAFWA